jgi:hypothetical protein
MSRLYYLLLVLCAVAVPGVLTAQRVQQAVATERLVLPRTITMEALEARCIEQARLKASETVYPKASPIATLARVLDTRTRFTDDFSVLTRTTVEGEWLGDIEQPVLEWSCEDGELAFPCSSRAVAASVLPLVGAPAARPAGLGRADGGRNPPAVQWPWWLGRRRACSHVGHPAHGYHGPRHRVRLPPLMEGPG